VFVQTAGLSKHYGPITALEDCSFSVEAGEILGLLGPNGAGKTTLIRLLLGYLQPTAGRGSIGGFDCYRESLQVRQLTAYLPGEACLFRTMRARGVLEFFAGIRQGSDLRRYLATAERLDLDLTRRVSQMSTGMRQKLALAATMAAETPLVILDEPTANLDPTVRGEVIAMVLEAKRAGRAVLFSSHVLSEVEEACDRVVILRSGQLVHTQPMAALRRSHRIRLTLRGALEDPPAELASQLTISRQGDRQVTLESADDLAELLAWLARQPLQEVQIEPMGLRGIYDRFHAPASPSAGHFVTDLA
jgi:ABC-2 type transport system ATP-binding protein